jgi:flagellar M-ring protein FliF
VNDFLQRLRTFYLALEPQRQTQLWLAIAVVIGLLVGMYVWVGQEPFAQVATGSSSDIGEAAAALNEEGISTKFDGAHLLVPEARLGEAIGVLYRARLSHTIADAAKMPMGASPTVIEWALRRQKEGDLSRALVGLPGVRGARVHIEPGEQSLFLDDNKKASASVFLDLSPSATLGGEQVAAIQAMVAGAVERLDPDAVAITDSRGRLLASGKGGSDPTRKAGTHMLELRNSYQQQLVSAVEVALRPFVGFDHAMTVSATVELDNATRTIRAQDLNPDKVVEISTMVDETERERARPNEEGTPGVDAALPERAEAGGAQRGGTNRETRAKSQANMMVPTTVTDTSEPAGRLIRAAVSISLDEARLASLWGTEPGSDVWERRLAEVDRVARAAMGFDSERGDQLALAVMPFAPVDVVEAPSFTIDGVLNRTTPLIPYGIAVLALLLAFAFVVRPLMARVAGAGTSSRTVEVGARTSGGSGGPDDDQLADRLHQLVENFQPVDATELNRLVEQQSEASVQVLRAWSKEG